jgi:aminoglycoside 3-N-acetyltransferase
MPAATQALPARLKARLKPFAVRWLLSYEAAALVRALRRGGLRPGDTLMVHASWRPDNGFRGSPADFVAALKEVVGPDGLLAMTSMTYHNEGSAEFLRRDRPMDVRRSPSRMGLLTEVFRRDPEVRRSLSPTHPVLAWGRDADAFVAGHEDTPRPFGPDSPFGRLLERNGKVLCIDAPFATVTFTHFLEDRIRDSLAVPLYEPEPMDGIVVDAEGRRRTVPTLVLSAAANALRREERLVRRLDEAGVLRRGRVGNTRLLIMDCRAMTDCADRMVAAGDSFFDKPGGPSADD